MPIERNDLYGFILLNPLNSERPNGIVWHMTLPLALLLYEKLLPGTQLANRLQDLNYRVHLVTPSEDLEVCAEQGKAMVVVADLFATRHDVSARIAKLKQNPATAHIPVIGFCDEQATDLQTAAKAAGATLVVTDVAILTHLPQFLEQALEVK
jgi:CheY-like chemotaxis protein